MSESHLNSALANQAEQKKKRLVLVYPPLTMPTSPSLGVSMLKGYLGRQVKDWDVVVVDLNLRCFQRFFAQVASGEMTFTAEGLKTIGGDKETLLRPARVFAGGDSAAFYSDPEQNDKLGTAFLRFTDIAVRGLAKLCAIWEKTQQPIPILQELVDRIYRSRQAQGLILQYAMFCSPHDFQNEAKKLNRINGRFARCGRIKAS